jgi:folate-binding protein YgfZ
MDHRLEGVCALPHLGVIAAVGEEAARFLHNQLTQDFVLMGEHEARLAGFCTAKGRMLASFIGVKRSATEVLLVTSADLLAPTLKRLSMFVLRAKAKLSDASSQLQVLGLAGQAATAALGDVAQPWGVRRDGTASIVRLYPADGVPRALWIAPADAAVPPGEALSPQAWAWAEVRSGIATVTAPVTEAFVPQMLNYESVGGVNFKKGCYPGQEVVARSQFRGTLKRRAALAHVAGPAVAGQEVFHSADPDQPCGLVVQSAPGADGGCDAIVSLQVSAMEGGVLTVGQAEGARLQLLSLPYPLLADI